LREKDRGDQTRSTVCGLVEARVCVWPPIALAVFPNVPFVFYCSTTWNCCSWIQVLFMS